MKNLELGNVVCTRAIKDWQDATGFYFDVPMCLQRHARCDWGEVCEEDKAQNDLALERGERVLSSYTVAGRTIWIITEWDRSVTTILFPEDY